MPRLPLPCVIFAGGKSSRMGSNKAFLPFGEYPTLYQYQLAKWSHHFASVQLCAKASTQSAFDVPLVTDIDEVFAPTSGFIGVFGQLAHPAFFALSVDAPFVDPEEVRAMHTLLDEGVDAVIATDGDTTHPLCGFYANSCREAFASAHAASRYTLGALLASLHVRTYRVADATTLTNLNHKKEYEGALSLCACYAHHA